MLTSLEGSITGTSHSYSCTADTNVKYVIDTNGSGLCINGSKLLNNEILNNGFTCDPYSLNADAWQEPKITLDKDFANQLAAEITKKISKQTDPLEKNTDVDEIEIPKWTGFINI